MVRHLIVRGYLSVKWCLYLKLSGIDGKRLGEKHHMVVCALMMYRKCKRQRDMLRSVIEARSAII